MTDCQPAKIRHIQYGHSFVCDMKMDKTSPLRISKLHKLK